MKTILYVHEPGPAAHERQLALEAAGYAVEPFAGGDALWRRLRTGPGDLVLLEVLLDGKHGFEVCRDLRAKYPSRELPIVMASEIYRSRAFREEALAAGAQSYVLLPIAIDDLVREIRGALAVAEATRTPV
jgi:DNA-binding response OmpR family regulator